MSEVLSKEFYFKDQLCYELSGFLTKRVVFANQKYLLALYLAIAEYLIQFRIYLNIP